MAGPLYRITFARAARSVLADGDTPLLQVAEGAGVVLPSSCRNGTCRTCLRRLVSGSVAYLIEWPGLSAEEKREGWVLPCVALARSDLTLG